MGRLSVAGLLRARVDDEAPGIKTVPSTWSWAEVVAAGVARAAAFDDELRVDGPPHIGVLLDNVPEFLWWVGAAALSGATIVGINPTRRGAELAADVRHTDCQLVVTDEAGRETLAGIVPDDRLLVVDDPGYLDLVERHADTEPGRWDPPPDTLLLLLFTSGSTGAPKAVRCTQGRLANIGQRMVAQQELTADDVCYCPMPLFHGNALMALWSPALTAGASVALPGRFSARGFLPDVRRFGATYFTYVGKALTYVLATPEQPDDADNPLERGFGNEASDLDIGRFERRFGCRLTDSYGASEGGLSITRMPGMPAGSLGKGTEGTTVVDPLTGEEKSFARFDDRGRLLNPDDAVGEIVGTAGFGSFEGYYRNDDAEAERTRNGWYWTGDLGYRDEHGWIWFAGRSADRLRVDGENLSTAPIEQILSRFPGVAVAAVYAVPDARSGDAVMACLELVPGATFDPSAFDRFLAGQVDLATKADPRFVRIIESMPLTGSHKVLKGPLRSAGWWDATDGVWWRPAKGEPYRRLDADARAALRAEHEAHGRLEVLEGSV